MSNKGIMGIVAEKTEAEKTVTERVLSDEREMMIAGSNALAGRLPIPQPVAVGEEITGWILPSSEPRVCWYDAFEWCKAIRNITRDIPEASVIHADHFDVLPDGSCQEFEEMLENLKQQGAEYLFLKDSRGSYMPDYLDIWVSAEKEVALLRYVLGNLIPCEVEQFVFVEEPEYSPAEGLNLYRVCWY